MFVEGGVSDLGRSSVDFAVAVSAATMEVSLFNEDRKYIEKSTGSLASDHSELNMFFCLISKVRNILFDVYFHKCSLLEVSVEVHGNAMLPRRIPMIEQCTKHRIGAST